MIHLKASSLETTDALNYPHICSARARLHFFSVKHRYTIINSGLVSLVTSLLKNLRLFYDSRGFDSR